MSFFFLILENQNKEIGVEETWNRKQGWLAYFFMKDWNFQLSRKRFDKNHKRIVFDSNSQDRVVCLSDNLTFRESRADKESDENVKGNEKKGRQKSMRRWTHQCLSENSGSNNRLIYFPSHILVSWTPYERFLSPKPHRFHPFLSCRDDEMTFFFFFELDNSFYGTDRPTDRPTDLLLYFIYFFSKIENNKSNTTMEISPSKAEKSERRHPLITDGTSRDSLGNLIQPACIELSPILLRLSFY